MIIDTKKISKAPKNQWEAVELMNEAQQRLLEALHIMVSMLENNTNDFKEIHEKRIKDFVKQFEA